MSVTNPPRAHPMPFCRVELAVMGLLNGRLQVLLAKRAEPPNAGRWALPGGVLRIDLDRSLELAARRVMSERLNLELPGLQQVCTVGGPTRDPRAPWSLSVVYRTMLQAGVAHAIDAKPGKRVEAVRWCPVDEVEADEALAFDHGALVAQAAAAVRAEVDRLEWPEGFVPEIFTLGELQAAGESALGRPLDKSSFRRKLAERDLVAPVSGQMRGGAFRPAQLYRLRSR